MGLQKINILFYEVEVYKGPNSIFMLYQISIDKFINHHGLLIKAKPHRLTKREILRPLKMKYENGLKMKIVIHFPQ